MFGCSLWKFAASCWTNGDEETPEWDTNWIFTGEVGSVTVAVFPATGGVVVLPPPIHAVPINVKAPAIAAILLEDPTTRISHQPLVVRANTGFRRGVEPLWAPRTRASE